MNISVALLLDGPTRDKIAVLWLDWVIDQVADRIQWLINNPPKSNMQVFASSIMLGHFIDPGCLCFWLVGSGERAGPNTH